MDIPKTPIPKTPIPKTPPRSQSPEDDDSVSLSSKPQKGRRPKHLRAAVFWELTDRRHYPPSPGTGLTLFSPISYPYNPSTQLPRFQDNDDHLKTLDCTNEHRSPTYEDVQEEAKEHCHENGYPIASSPTFKKATRDLQDHATDEGLAQHLSTLDLDNHTRTSHHPNPKHLDRKARIRNSKTVGKFKVSRPPFGRVQKDKQLNMHQLSKWAGQDVERKKLVAGILHGRCDDRTERLMDPFTDRWYAVHR